MSFSVIFVKPMCWSLRSIVEGAEGALRNLTITVSG
jgi:hypothetical protein